MSTWSAHDPGAGDLAGILSRMATLAGVRDHASSMQYAVRRTISAVPDVWSGVAADAWEGSAALTATAWDSLHEWAAGEYAALSSYVSAVESIAARARVQQSLLLEATAALPLAVDGPMLEVLSPGDATLAAADAAAAGVPASGRLHAEVTAANRALAGLAAERLEVEDALGRALHRTRADAEPILESWSAPRFEPTSRADTGATELLSLLPGFAPADLRLLATDTSLATRLRALDPAEVARWWRGLSPTAKRRIVADAPELVGSLDGVAYADRDEANRSILARTLTALRTERDRLRSESDVARVRDGRIVDGPRLQAVLAEIASLQAVDATLAAAAPGLPRQLVLLADLDSWPRASVSIGDLDTADHVTYLVPGMSTTVAGDMIGWTAAAARLRSEQASVLAKAKETRSIAAVSWIGYEPPGPSDIAGVLGEDLARAGGAALAHDIDGLTSARGWHPGHGISVVAHSYGTTTAAFALHKAAADSFVMLGSAGLPLEVRHADDLLVPHGRVAASLSKHDGLAPVGQIFGGRRDPTAEGFGSDVFSSNATNDDGHRFEGVTQHGPLVHAKPSDGYSYLDANTTALRSSALLSMGREALDAR